MSAIKKPAIPPISSLPIDIARVVGPLKEHVEIITGIRGGELTQLSASATDAEIIQAINAIIVKLNASGA
jgi:hypothetical protein